MSYYCVWCHTWAILCCLLLPLIILHKSGDMVAVFQMGINTITTFFTRLILLYNEQLFPVSVSVLWGVTTRNHNEALSVTVCIHLNVSVFFCGGCFSGFVWKNRKVGWQKYPSNADIFARFIHSSRAVLSKCQQNFDARNISVPANG